MSVFNSVRSALSKRAHTSAPAHSFNDAAARAGALQRRMPRAETVDMERIVGSVGRAHEVSRDFRPPRRRRRQADNERFERVLRAMTRGPALPPVQLYRLGSDYYVLDGHHRLAAAISLGQLAVDAHVTEFVAAQFVVSQAVVSGGN
jgi:ParB/Sulfiredoxin domain